MESGWSLRSVALGAALVCAGLVAGWAVVFEPLDLILYAVLPPFRPEDDDTLREFGPAALAYLVWAATTVVVVLAGWRLLRPARRR
jgi:hypothetical protein